MISLFIWAVFNNQGGAAIRVLRVLKLFKLSTFSTGLRIVMEGLLSSVESVGWVLVIILLFNGLACMVCLRS